MKIYVLNESKQGLGGGWSFIRNFKKGVEQIGHEITDKWQNADVVLIPSASMVLTDTVDIIKSAGKKIVLRLDNIPRNSRNRNSGTSRLKRISELADGLIYQSLWSRNYLLPFLGRLGEVVYNGIDTDIFSRHGAQVNFGADKKIYLYSRYNRDETKGWERTWYQFQMIYRQNTQAKLVIVGQFSDELTNCHFDFFNGEDIEYLGVIDDPERMAQILRGTDVLLAPYFNDCYSNTIQEAMGCGALIETDLSGGTPELLANGVRDLKTMALDYIKVLQNI